MKAKELSGHAGMEELELAAADLVRAYASGEADAIQRIVDLVVNQVVDRRVLREQAVPVHAAPWDLHRLEKLRDRGRCQQAFDAQLLAIEQLEVTAQHKVPRVIVGVAWLYGPNLRFMHKALGYVMRVYFAQGVKKERKALRFSAAETAYY